MGRSCRLHTDWGQPNLSGEPTWLLHRMESVSGHRRFPRLVLGSNQATRKWTGAHLLFLRLSVGVGTRPESTSWISLQLRQQLLHGGGGGGGKHFTWWSTSLSSVPEPPAGWSLNSSRKVRGLKIDGGGRIKRNVTAEEGSDTGRSREEGLEGFEGCGEKRGTPTVTPQHRPTINNQTIDGSCPQSSPVTSTAQRQSEI